MKFKIEDVKIKTKENGVEFLSNLIDRLSFDDESEYYFSIQYNNLNECIEAIKKEVKLWNNYLENDKIEIISFSYHKTLDSEEYIF